MEWTPARGTGAVYSLMERHAPAAALTTVVAVITLDAGPQMMGLIEAAPGRVKAGDRVHATLAQPREGLPTFAMGPGSE